MAGMHSPYSSIGYAPGNDDFGAKGAAIEIPVSRGRAVQVSRNQTMAPVFLAIGNCDITEAALNSERRTCGFGTKKQMAYRTTYRSRPAALAAYSASSARPISAFSESSSVPETTLNPTLTVKLVRAGIPP